MGLYSDKSKKRGGIERRFLEPFLKEWFGNDLRFFFLIPCLCSASSWSKVRVVDHEGQVVEGGIVNAT